jgi:hypothetical protein
MLAHGPLPAALVTRPSLAEVLRDAPGWRWGDSLLDDPLLRAQDKEFEALRGRPERLAVHLATLRDLRALAEFRSRAERRCRDLERQLEDARALGLPQLEAAAAQELSDQRALLRHIPPLD